MKRGLLFAVLLFALSACASEPSLFEVYRGEWLWVATFEDDEPFVGSLSISTRRPGSGGVADIGVGPWIWCEASGRCPHLPGDQGSLGVYPSTGERRLVLEFTEAAGFAKLIALHSGASLEDEESGEALFAGPGRWYFYSGGSAIIGFAMIKIAEAPLTLPQGSQPRPFVAAADLPLLLSQEGDERSERLMQQARAHLESLLD